MLLDGAYSVVKSLERGLRRTLRSRVNVRLPAHFEPDFKPIYDACKPYTMTSPARMHALFDAVRHVARAGVEGDIVECGVWRGGSAMVAAMTLLAERSTARDLYLYDTYEGMSQPSEKDVGKDGRSARDRWLREHRGDGESSDWCFAPLDDVRRNLASTGYPVERVHFVQGKVEQTIPNVAPQRIAVLRLDTDWYESTYHELVHLYPRLVVGGILILDDYGHWRGAREATDEYFRQHGKPPFLWRIDDASRISLKTAR